MCLHNAGQFKNLVSVKKESAIDDDPADAIETPPPESTKPPVEVASARLVKSVFISKADRNQFDYRLRRSLEKIKVAYKRLAGGAINEDLGDFANVVMNSKKDGFLESSSVVAAASLRRKKRQSMGLG